MHVDILLTIKEFITTEQNWVVLTGWIYYYFAFAPKPDNIRKIDISIKTKSKFIENIHFT